MQDPLIHASSPSHHLFVRPFFLLAVHKNFCARQMSSLQIQFECIAVHYREFRLGTSQPSPASRQTPNEGYPIVTSHTCLTAPSLVSHHEERHLRCFASVGGLEVSCCLAIGLNFEKMPSIAVACAQRVSATHSPCTRVCAPCSCYSRNLLTGYSDSVAMAA
jgi:hypothetical protein